MKSLSKMPQKLVLFFLPKLREKRPNSLGREREAGALLLSSFSFLSNLPPISLLSLCLRLSCPSLLGAPPFSSARTDGDTPLIMAAKNGHTEVVAALLAGGANANQGKHPLFLSDLFHCAGSRPPMPPQRPAPTVSSLSLHPCSSPSPARDLTLAHPHRSWGDRAQTKA